MLKIIYSDVVEVWQFIDVFLNGRLNEKNFMRVPDKLCDVLQ